MKVHSEAQGSLKRLYKDMHNASERHDEKYRDEINGLIGKLQEEFTTTLCSFLDKYSNRKNEGQELNDTYHVLENYLNKMVWVGWGNCEFGPPLEIVSVEEFSLSILVYLSARLIDDGIDGHLDYKNKVKCFYGYLIEKGIGEREASGLSSLMGNFLLNSSLHRLYKKGYTESGDFLSNIYLEVISGALTEAICNKTNSVDLYRSIVRNKSVQYDMMLHGVFLRQVEPGIKAMILSILTDFSETAQWLNDLCDEKDDRKREQLNILNMEGMSHEILVNKIISSFNLLWRKAHSLPQNIQDVMASRFKNPVKTLIEITENISLF